MHPKIQNLLAAASAGRTLQLSDNDLAVEFLRHVQPQWIDELPALASTHAPGSNVVTRSLWDKRNGVVVLVQYLGRGFPSDDSGWLILIKPCRSKKEFDHATNLMRLMGNTLAAMPRHGGQ